MTYLRRSFFLTEYTCSSISDDVRAGTAFEISAYSCERGQAGKASKAMVQISGMFDGLRSVDLTRKNGKIVLGEEGE